MGVGDRYLAIEVQKRTNLDFTWSSLGFHLGSGTARRIPGRDCHAIPIYFHQTATLSIMRPLFGQHCTECRWSIDLRDGRPPPSDDIGRKRKTPMNSTPAPKPGETNDASIAGAG